MASYAYLDEAYSAPNFSQKRRAPSQVPVTPAQGIARREGFENGREDRDRRRDGTYKDPPSAIGMRDRVTYAGQKTDYDYACKNYGICNPSLEGFIAPLDPPNAHDPVPGARPKAPQQSCAPLSPPPYEYPLSGDDKRAFQRAVNQSLDDVPARFPSSASPPAWKVEMDGVSGYVDDEMNNYLNIKEMKSESDQSPGMKRWMSQMTAPAELPGLTNTPYSEVNNREALAGSPVPLPPSPMAQAEPLPVAQAPAQAQQQAMAQERRGLWMDVVIFVSAGLLLIFLLDALFKIAMNVGMRHTVQILDELVRRMEAAKR